MSFMYRTFIFDAINKINSPMHSNGIVAASDHYKDM